MIRIDWEVNPWSGDEKIPCDSCGADINVADLYLFREDKDFTLCRECGINEIDDVIRDLKDLREILQ